MCTNLTVLYLYDNNITYIGNLSFASNLTHLYMQNNSITHIDNLHNLQNLSKLWVKFNWLVINTWSGRCVFEHVSDFRCSAGISGETELLWWRA